MFRCDLEGERLICTFDWSSGGKSYYYGTWGEFTLDDIKQEKLLDGLIYDYVDGSSFRVRPKIIRTIGAQWYGLLDCQDFTNARGYIFLTHFERNGQVVYHWDIEAPASFRENRRLFPTGTQWREASYTPGSQVRYDDYAIGEETIVGQKTYRRVMKNGADSGLLIREEGCDVWLPCDEYPEEIKLYDFDWLSFEQPTVEYLRESSGGLALMTDIGINLDDVSLWYSAYRNQQVTIRGRMIMHDVGCLSGSRRDACLLGYKEPASVGPGTTKSMVVWFRRKSPVGISGYDESVPDDWLTGITSPSGDTAPTAQGLYDLQGRRLRTAPRHGVYVEDGRKVVR